MSNKDTVPQEVAQDNLYQDTYQENLYQDNSYQDNSNQEAFVQEQSMEEAAAASDIPNRSLTTNKSRQRWNWAFNRIVQVGMNVFLSVLVFLFFIVVSRLLSLLSSGSSIHFISDMLFISTNLFYDGGRISYKKYMTPKSLQT